MVGFPGENEADFEETLSLLEEVGYEGTFSFKYSPRPSTPALARDGQVPEEEKGRRLAVLQNRQRQIQQARNERLIGQTAEVFVEAHNPRTGQYTGRMTTNRIVNFAGVRVQEGTYRTVRILRAGPNSLVGELI